MSIVESARKIAVVNHTVEQSIAWSSLYRHTRNELVNTVDIAPKAKDLYIGYLRGLVMAAYTTKLITKQYRDECWAEIAKLAQE